MTTVRDAVYELLRERGMTTVFGNPGSTELHFLTGFPEDFTYVLALQEAGAVGLADGYAQASGQPVLVSLHSAAGLGNAMGAIYNAGVHKAPLVITAGQQQRSLLTVGGHLMNRDATRMPDPHVKWSYEPPRAEDVPHALARAVHIAATPPCGPTFVSVPMEDWFAEVDTDAVAHQIHRRVDPRAPASPWVVSALARRLENAERPAMVCGPDVDASGGWDAAVALAERQRLPVYSAPLAGAGRIGFPESHPLFRGILPLAVGPVSEALAGHDLVLVVGSSVFAYFLEVPGPYLAPETSLVAVTSDPGEAARAPMGDAIVADVAMTLAALVEEVAQSTREAPVPRAVIAAPTDGVPMSSPSVMAALGSVLPEDAIVVVEASCVLALREQVPVTRPGSFYYIGGGGLGWGLPAAVGIAMARPDRPVVCVLGDGASQYTIQAFWTAAAYGVPVTFLILRNDEYAILRWLSEQNGTSGVPGLDLPGMEIAAIASDYGIESCQVTEGDGLRVALRDAVAAEAPRLVEVRVASGEVPF